MKNIVIVAVLFVAFSTVSAQAVLYPAEPKGVSQPNCDSLELENVQLQAQVDSLKVEVLTLMIRDIRQEPIVEDASERVDNNKNGKFFVSEDMALEIIKDDYSFYRRNYVYKKVMLRRVSNTEFTVSLDQCSRSNQEDYMWNAVIRTLIINSDGTYRFY